MRRCIAMLSLGLLLYILSIALVSCNASKHIADTYRSRFASMGFFVTTIQLNKDSTLKYNFRGDLINESATGYYHRNGDTLALFYAWNASDYNDILAGTPDEYRQRLPAHDTVRYRGSYIIGHNKLFPIHLVTGKKVTQSRRYNKRRKFIFFGSHYYSRRFYLKRLHEKAY